MGFAGYIIMGLILFLSLIRRKYRSMGWILIAWGALTLAWAIIVLTTITDGIVWPSFLQAAVLLVIGWVMLKTHPKRK